MTKTQEQHIKSLLDTTAADYGRKITDFSIEPHGQNELKVSYTFTTPEGFYIACVLGKEEALTDKNITAALHDYDRLNTTFAGMSPEDIADAKQRFAERNAK